MKRTAKQQAEIKRVGQEVYGRMELVRELLKSGDTKSFAQSAAQIMHDLNRVVFLADKMHLHICFIVTSDRILPIGLPQVMMPFVPDDMKGRAFRAFIRSKAAEMDALAVIEVAEVWQHQTKKGEADPIMSALLHEGMRLENLPKSVRQEALITTCETKSGDKHAVSSEIVRKGKKVSLNPVANSEYDRCVGGFAGFFPASNPSRKIFGISG